MRKLIGENFARLRKERGLTQEQVEERSGFSQWYISSLERGRRNPTIISLYELASAIGVPVADLIADDPLSMRQRIRQIENLEPMWMALSSPLPFKP